MQDRNATRSLAAIRNSVQIRLHTTDNARIHKLRIAHGIEGTLRSRATWLAIEAAIDERDRQSLY